MTKHGIKQVIYVIAMMLLIVTFIVCWLGWYHLPLGPFMDDGPFHGLSVSPITDRKPDQTFTIWNNLTLEVFDPKSDNVSPVIQLRESADQILWSIQADGLQAGDVKKIRFTSHERGITRAGSLYGHVEWTYTNEMTTWFITGNGELRDYWYSW